MDTHKKLHNSNEPFSMYFGFLDDITPKLMSESSIIKKSLTQGRRDCILGQDLVHILDLKLKYFDRSKTPRIIPSIKNSFIFYAKNRQRICWNTSPDIGLFSLPHIQTKVVKAPVGKYIFFILQQLS